MVLAASLTAFAAPAAEEAPAPFVRVFDTKAPSPAALPGEALAKRAGWLAVPEDKTSHKFTGDAVLANDKLALVLRKSGAGAELYSAGPGETWTPRGTLAVCTAAATAAAGATTGPAATAMPVGETPTVAIVENTPGASMLAATFRTKAGSPATARFRLTAGLPILECRAAEGAAAFEIRDAIRYVVVPELLAQDCVLGPAAMTGPRTGIPAENMLMALLGDGEAIGMFTWKSNERNADALCDMPASRPGAASRPADGAATIRACRIECRPGESAWYSLLQAPSIWHGRAVMAADLSKTVDVPWKAPFPAKWRCAISFVRYWPFSCVVGERDSATLTVEDLRTVELDAMRAWCWSQPAGLRARLPQGRPDGSVTSLTTLDLNAALMPHALAVYPLDRTAGTETAYCPIDVMRETLGVGACQYLLDIEGLGADGDITPQQTAEWVLKTFERKREAKEVAEIRRRFDAARRCVAAKEDRLGAYADAYVRMHTLCNNAKTSGQKEASNAAALVDEYVAPSAEVQANHGKDLQLTGARAKLVEIVRDETVKLIGKPDALPMVRRIAHTMRAQGEELDMGLAGARMELRVIVQLTRDLAEKYPAAAEFLGKVRAEAQGALRKKPSATADKGDSK